MNLSSIISSMHLLILMVIISGVEIKEPTEGPDIEKPTVLATSPIEFGDISSGVIEIILF